MSGAVPAPHPRAVRAPWIGRGLSELLCGSRITNGAFVIDNGSDQAGVAPGIGRPIPAQAWESHFPSHRKGPSAAGQKNPLTRSPRRWYHSDAPPGHARLVHLFTPGAVEHC